ncbi:MAG: hypothetical protein JW955_24660 [Sedimentisphaerales bacterium]|nr:hypothetical protein [Sedimentisphaerales bacterium]
MNVRHSRRKTIVVCAALLQLVVPHSASRAQDRFRVDAGASFLLGSIDGYLQTPAGGTTGSTSIDRPTLGELGMKSVHAGDFWANLFYGHHGLYAGGRIIHLSGDGTLDEPLVSQSIAFAAGLPVKANIQLDWYRLGYRYRLPLDWGDRTIELYPSIGAALFDFQYTLAGQGIDSVDRSYTTVGAQIGFGLTWPLTKRWSLCGEVLAPIPISHTPEILSAQLALKYRLLTHKGLSLSGLFGVGYDQIRYEDGQALPNEIEAELGPMGVLGLEIRF